MANQDPTANWRKYPKGPNFLGIVIGSCVVMLLIFVAVIVVLKGGATHMVPHRPNPRPNSLLILPLEQPVSGQAA